MANLSGVFSRSRSQPAGKQAVMPPAAPAPVPRDTDAERVIRDMYETRQRNAELLAEVAGLQQDLETERRARHAAEQQCAAAEDIARRLQYANTRIVTKSDAIITLMNELAAEVMANNLADPVPHVPNIPPRRRVDLSALEEQIRKDIEELRGEAGSAPNDEADAQELYADERPAGAHVHDEGSVR